MKKMNENDRETVPVCHIRYIVLILRAECLSFVRDIICHFQIYEELLNVNCLKLIRKRQAQWVMLE